MRTTVRLDDDVYHAVKSLSEHQAETFGQVLSDLARRGLEQKPRIRYDDELPVFDVPAGAPLMTPQLVDELLDDGS